MILRPYQSQAGENVMAEFQNVNSTLVVMPTGLGKTILFADIVRRFFPRRALVLAHREELIFQAKDKIERVTGLTCAVEMADYRVNDHDMFHGAASVVVSSIQTQCSGGDGGGRMTKFDPAGFGLIVIDEAHHATAGSYKRIIEYYRNNPNVKILGVTATPDRADEEALGQIYETVAFDYEILDAINDGWLVPIQQQIVSVGALDFSQVRTTAGDLNGGDLAEIMEAEECLHSIATPTMEIIGSRRTLVFASSVKHAERLAEIFNRHQEGCAAWVCGKTPKDERRKILADFAAGRIQIVANCGVLTEGFDDPGVEVIIMGRPTKSRSLYAQMVGRATRPLPGVVDGPETAELRKWGIETSAKPCCLVVDFCGNSGRHKLMTSADILGGKCSDEALKKAVDKITKSKKAMSMTDALAESEEEIKAEKRKKELLESAKRIRLKAAASFRTQNVNPFDVLQLSPAKDRGWDSGKHLSNKQVELLAKNGIADADKMPYGQAKQLLNEMFRRWDGNLCSFKQAKILAKNGLPVDVSREVATKTIDAIVANGWKVPANINDVINQKESDHVPF